MNKRLLISPQRYSMCMSTQYAMTEFPIQSILIHIIPNSI